MANSMNFELMLFTSPTCGPCKVTKPAMLKLQEQYRFRLRIVELSENTMNEFGRWGVKAVPTCIALDDSGNKVGSFMGAQSNIEEKLRKWGVI